MIILPEQLAPDDPRHADVARDAVYTARVYPIPSTEDDDRFTCGLTLDVADVLTRHGFPVSGGDVAALHHTLAAFLYADRPDHALVGALVPAAGRGAQR